MLRQRRPHRGSAFIGSSLLRRWTRRRVATRYPAPRYKQLVRRAWVCGLQDTRYERTAVLSLEDRMRRMSVLVIGLFFLGSVLLLRLYQLQTSQHKQWLELAAKQHETSIEVQQPRGTVFDAGGRAVAVSVPTVSVAVHPHKVTDEATAVQRLSQILGLSPAVVREKLQSTKPFVWLRRGLPQEVADAAHALGVAGVVVIPEFSRYYPQGKGGGPVLGRVSRDGLGQSGIELQYNDELTRDYVRVPVRRDARGKLVAVGGPSAGTMRRIGLRDDPRLLLNSPEMIAGHPGSVQLSIDMAIQEIMEQELREGVINAKAKRGLAVMMDADSGEVLAMAQNPSFDPNDPDVSPSELKNFLIQDSFEPGSTLKPIVAAAALDAGVVRLDEMIDGEKGRFRFGGKLISDVHGVGLIPFSEALVRSSNVCMAKVGSRLGKERLHAALERLGFGAPTGIELPGEAGGILRGVRSWREIDIATHSFGHGVSVTALQLVRAFSAVLNGGWLVQPTVLKRPADDLVSRVKVLDSRISRALYRVLIDVTESKEGTARQAAMKFFPVSGKTGTAHKVKAGGHGYDPDEVMASFIGFVDARDQGIARRVTLFVAMDEPGVRPRWGGTVAAPVFRKIMERTLPHLMTLNSESGETT